MEPGDFEYPNNQHKNNQPHEQIAMFFHQTNSDAGLGWRGPRPRNRPSACALSWRMPGHVRMKRPVPGAHGRMHLMMTRTAKTAIAAGLAGALTMATTAPTWAAPVLSSTAAVKTADPLPTTEVRYWHHGFGPGAAIGGLALGLAGAAVAAPYYGYGYPGYGPGYAYGPGYYGYGPGYYGPGYGWGPRWHHRWHRW
jgi:hypothetical protein